MDTEKMKYKLVRHRDQLTKFSEEIKWITFDNSQRVNGKYDEIKIGRALLMSPFNNYFTWMTTEAEEILSNEEVGCIFRTKNSIYTLTLI